MKNTLLFFTFYFLLFTFPSFGQGNFSGGTGVSAKNKDSTFSIIVSLDTVNILNSKETHYQISEILKNNTLFQFMRVTLSNETSENKLTLTIEEFSPNPPRPPKGAGTKNIPVQPVVFTKSYNWNETGAMIMVNGCDTVPFKKYDSNYAFLAYFKIPDKENGFAFLSKLCYPQPQNSAGAGVSAGNAPDYYIEIQPRIPDNVIRQNEVQYNIFEKEGNQQKLNLTFRNYRDSIQKEQTEKRRKDSIRLANLAKDKQEFSAFLKNRDTAYRHPDYYTQRRMEKQIEDALLSFCVQKTPFHFPFSFNGILNISIDTSGNVTDITSKQSVAADPNQNYNLFLLKNNIKSIAFIPDSVAFHGNKSIEPKVFSSWSNFNYALINFAGDTSIVVFKREQYKIKKNQFADTLEFKSGLHTGDKVLKDTILNRLNKTEGKFKMHTRYYNLKDEMIDKNIYNIYFE